MLELLPQSRKIRLSRRLDMATIPWIEHPKLRPWWFIGYVDMTQFRTHWPLPCPNCMGRHRVEPPTYAAPNTYEMHTVVLQYAHIKFVVDQPRRINRSLHAWLGQCEHCGTIFWACNQISHEFKRDWQTGRPFMWQGPEDWHNSRRKYDGLS